MEKRPRRKAGRRDDSAQSLMLRHVMVVEDDAILALACEETLRSGGVERVDVCSTTDLALETLREHRPDAIVLDVHLADRDDGWAIAELVRNLGENCPRIVFSTGAPQDIPPEIAELGHVLTKPYAPDALLAALREPEHRGLFSRLRNALS